MPAGSWLREVQASVTGKSTTDNSLNWLVNKLGLRGIALRYHKLQLCSLFLQLCVDARSSGRRQEI